MTSSYSLDGLTGLMLGDIPALFKSPYTEVISRHFKGKKFMCLLPGGQLYFNSKLSLDLDGSPFWTQDRPDSQPQTSVRWEDNASVDFERVQLFRTAG